MHDHGRVYRAKIVSADGRTEYGEWFNTEKELRDAMQGVPDHAAVVWKSV